MDSRELAELAAEACDDKKAQNIELFKIEEVSSLADWVVISEGFSDVQVRAIVKSVEDKLETDAKRLPLRKEGVNEAKWSLLDYGELIVHVLQPNERQYYDLEAFWSNGKKFSYQNQSSNIKL